VKKWVEYAAVVALAALVFVLILRGIGEGLTDAEQICAKAKESKTGCVIADARVVYLETGSVFMTTGGKVYQLK